MPSEKEHAERIAISSAYLDRSLVGVIRLGLRVVHKWDRVSHYEKGQGRPPTSADILRLGDAFTPSEEDGFSSEAGRLIDGHLREVREDGAPPTKWSTGFWQAYWGAFAYSLTLLLVYLIV